MCMHIAEKLGVEGAKKHGLTDRMEFRKKSNNLRKIGNSYSVNLLNGEIIL